MRKSIVLFATLFLVVSICFATSISIKGDEVPIPLESQAEEEDTSIFRGPSIPIYAVLDHAKSIIIISFSDDIGNVSIELSNLITGERSYYIEDSTAGNAILSFSGGSGYYLIQFTTEGRRLYFGYFSV